MKKFALVVSVVLVAALLFGCGNASNDSDGGGSASPPPANTGSSGAGSADTGSGDAAVATEHSRTFTVVTGDDMMAIDPHNLNGPADRQVMKMCYEPLVDTDHYGNHYGVLAESWAFNEDATELTFVLKQGVTFSNGEPFNADVALYNIERLVAHHDDFAIPIMWFFNLTGGEKIDDYTVKMIFSQPSPLITSNLNDFVMIPMKMHQELGDQMFVDVNNSGTGPWIWDEWVSGQYAHLTKNETYRDIANYDSYFDDGYIRFVSEPNSAAAAQLSGEADMYISMGGIGYEILALYEGSEDAIDIVEKKDMFSYLDIRLGFQEGSPLYDPLVREAVDLAIDRQLIADQLTRSGRIPEQFLLEGVVGYDPAIPPYAYDPERAKQLLAESSYDGETLQVLGYPGAPNAEDFSLSIASMLEDVGFNVETPILDLVAFNEEKDKGEWDIMPANTLISDGNPGPTFNWFLADYMKANFSGPEAEEFFDMCREFVVETDPARREEIAVAANNWLSDYHGTVLPVAMIDAVWTQSKGLTGVVMFPDNYWDITFIDWDPAAV